MLLFRPDETRTTRQLIFELRNGAGIPQRHVDKINGEWREVDASERLVMKDYGERLDAGTPPQARRDPADLVREAGQALLHRQPVRRALRARLAWAAERTIRERVSRSRRRATSSISATADSGLPSSGRTKFGYLCVEGMVLRLPAGDVDPATGELPMREHTVLPPTTSARIPAPRCLSRT